MNYDDWQHLEIKIKYSPKCCKYHLQVQFNRKASQCNDGIGVEAHSDLIADEWMNNTPCCLRLLVDNNQVRDSHSDHIQDLKVRAMNSNESKCVSRLHIESCTRFPGSLAL